VPNAPAPRAAAGKGSDPGGEAVKLPPPLTITDAELDQGLELLADAVRSVC
jgi:4-aminobutyrate aminotransferase-like enzyme